jgi:hypothetical protein
MLDGFQQGRACGGLYGTRDSEIGNTHIRAWR